MALTLTQFLSLMADEVGDGGNDTNNTIYLNMALRDVWRYGEWTERKAAPAFVNTVAPISTGTVDVTNGDATVTEDAGTPDFTSPDVAGRKFALGYAKTPYVIDSTTDADNFELAQTYAGDTATAQTYVIYDDIVKLASDVDVLHSVWCHDSDRAYELRIVTEKQATHHGRYPRQSERPWFAALVENASDGARQIRIGPFAPDEVYRIEYRYLKTATDLSSGSDVTGLRAELDDAVLSLALSHAYRRDHYKRSVQQAAIARRIMQEELRRDHPATATTHFVRRSEMGPVVERPYDINDLEI